MKLRPSGSSAAAPTSSSRASKAGQRFVHREPSFGQARIDDGTRPTASRAQDWLGASRGVERGRSACGAQSRSTVGGTINQQHHRRQGRTTPAASPAASSAGPRGPPAGPRRRRDTGADLDLRARATASNTSPPPARAREDAAKPRRLAIGDGLAVDLWHGFVAAPRPAAGRASRR